MLFRSVPFVHPLMMAKAGATIDAISRGRFALNIVCGWFDREADMFGTRRLTHDERYEYAADWVTTLKRLWTEEKAFDAVSKYFEIKGAMSQPKPLQRPHPPLMNAGGSTTGQTFVARHCDIAFVVPRGDDDALFARQIDEYRELARKESGREIQVWTSGYVSLAESIAEAEKFIDYYAIEHGDEPHVEGFITENAVRSRITDPAVIAKLKRTLKAGTGEIGRAHV